MKSSKRYSLLVIAKINGRKIDLTDTPLHPKLKLAKRSTPSWIRQDAVMRADQLFDGRNAFSKKITYIIGNREAKKNSM